MTREQLAAEVRRLRQEIARLRRERFRARESGRPTGQGDDDAEGRYRSLVETLNEGLAIMDEEGALSYVNEPLCNMLGYEREALIAAAFHDLSPAVQPDGQASQEKMAAQLQIALDKGRAFFEWQFRRRDGHLLDTDVSLSRLASSDTDALAAVVRDVTARKQAERSLAQERETFLSVVQHAPYGIALIDGDQIIYLNPAVTKMLGYTLSEIPTIARAFERFYPDPEYRDRLYGEWRKEIMTAEEADQEASVRCKDGTVKEIEFRTTRLANDRIIVMLCDITQRKRVEEALRHMSLIDDLTGLYNRRGFVTLAEQHLKLAERARRPLSLFFIDVDNMKWINDTYGHLEGDEVLTLLGGVLREAFRESDLLARIGGDEFVVLAIDATPESTQHLVSRLRSRVRERNARLDKPYRLSISVGVAFYDGHSPPVLDELLAQADEAMYREKNGGRGPDAPS